MHATDRITAAAVTSTRTELELELDSDDNRNLYVIPSTRELLDAIPVWLERPKPPFVVAPLVRDCQSSQSVLPLLDAGDGPSARPVIVFSDQLTSAIDAPILVGRNGRQYYLSALEVIANSRYLYSVNVWLDGRFKGCRPSADPLSVLRLIDDHLVACEDLGQDWLLRERQVHRARTAQSNQAHARLRAFHSALMCAYPTSDAPEDVRAIIQRVVEGQRILGCQSGGSQ